MSCPFCHHKAEYVDAPQGSTVRCHDCGSIFRVPAIRRGQAGTVVRGEQIRRSRAKFVVVLIILLIAAGGGYCAWLKYGREKPVPEDPFAGREDLADPATSRGTLQRFLESWKLGDLELMVRYCRPSEEPDMEWVESVFGNVDLTSYKEKPDKAIGVSRHVYRVDLEGEDARTKARKKGRMTPTVVLEGVPGSETKWGVDLASAAPRWD